MAGVQTLEVSSEDDGLRLDRWFKRHFPDLSHGRLEKLLRKGDVRVDKKRAKSGQRLEAGQFIRVPPLGERPAPPVKPQGPSFSQKDADEILGLILHMDDNVIVLNKPPGLAVQGGTRISRHLDGMLEALKFKKKDAPRLVHRLDKDTSGVLVLGRSANDTAKLAKSFRDHKVEKTYWALVVGNVGHDSGQIDVPLAKAGTATGEKVVGSDDGRKAVTLFKVLERAGRRAAWIALRPLTGRTHQLRVHCAAMGTPVQGDGKYGRRDAFLEAEEISDRLHLHARRLRLPHPAGGFLDVTAPLPPHMAKTWKFFGLDEKTADEDPFAETEG